MLNTQFSPWPSFTQEEADAVSQVLLSNKVNYWTGTECREFEKEFAAWAGTDYAVALANGTLALDVALQAMGIGEGDEVIVTPRSFIASVSTVVNAGAMPVFADVEPDTGNLSARTIAPHITDKTKGIICVHLAGWPCDMDEIMALAKQHNLWVIEDCAQAHGAKYKGRPVGSIGHVGAWSFCQDKIMTTGGEGGMVTTNDKALWQKMLGIRSDITELMASADFMIMPSLHEGFPVVLVESQAVGLHTLVSDRVSAEVDFGLGLIHFLSITSEKEWVDYLETPTKSPLSNDIICQKIQEAGFDVIENANSLLSFYKTCSQ